MNQKINAAFHQSNGKAVSILSIIKDGKLFLLKCVSYRTDTQSETLLISDNYLIEDADILFTSENLMDAFQSYKRLKAMGKCVIHQDLARYEPDKVMEVIGVKDNGKDDINMARLENGHLAFLATCWFYEQSIHQDSALNAFNTLQESSPSSIYEDWQGKIFNI